MPEASYGGAHNASNGYGWQYDLPERWQKRQGVLPCLRSERFVLHSTDTHPAPIHWHTRRSAFMADFLLDCRGNRNADDNFVLKRTKK